MSVKINLIGKRFGNLTVIQEHHSDKKHLYWLCKCDCGNEKIICGDSLKQGKTKSCGCFNVNLVKQRQTTHGKSHSRIYHIWTGMIYRCENSNATNFQYYGSKGVTVCDEWQNSFETFYNWSIQNGYADNLEIDRIDPDGCYCPENCQWITKSENVRKMWIDKRNKKKILG